jgi:hypothetical protein
VEGAPQPVGGAPDLPHACRAVTGTLPACRTDVQQQAASTTLGLRRGTAACSQLLHLNESCLRPALALSTLSLAAAAAGEE